jgi:small subunit ribosomal protein S15
MARMHSRKKGKSASKFPIEKKQKAWMRYTSKEVELLITKLAKDDHSQSEIGLILRDTYGVPHVKVLCGKSVHEILEAKKLSSKLPEDMSMLIRRFIDVKKHLELNHKDMTAKRGLQLTLSKINRVAKYYKRAGKLAKEWKFDTNQPGMFLE